MSIFKSHPYGVRTEWHDGRRVTVSAPGEPVLDVAFPSDFKNGVRAALDRARPLLR